MAKEFHITYSCDTEEEDSKMAISRIQRAMKDNGAELISKNDDFDGNLDIVFHHFTTYENITKLCNNVLEALKNSHVHVTAYVCEHKPKVLVDSKDVKDIEEFKTFIEEIGKNHGIVSLKQDINEPNLYSISFERSNQRQSFQNEYTSKAASFMNSGHSSVDIFPDWEDITILQKNNHIVTKKESKFGY